MIDRWPFELTLHSPRPGGVWALGVLSVSRPLGGEVGGRQALLSWLRCLSAPVCLLGFTPLRNSGLSVSDNHHRSLPTVPCSLPLSFVTLCD